MRNSIKRFITFVVAFALLFLSSCSDNDVAPKKVVLVEVSKILTRTASELRNFIAASSIDLDVTALKYDVDLYKVTYKTTYQESEITASGLVLLPKTADAVGMVSFQHGTIVAWKDAPTALPLSSTELILYAALGSAGFIGVVPDYIGFGESKNIFHPYYVEETTANAVIDNLKAARELAATNNINFNKKLFLAGYSQGGYATMAAHKAIETNGLDGFDLTASFPASGGYNVKGMQEYFFNQQVYDQPHYIAYVASSYKSYYGWTENLNQFFNEPYATRIPTLFNGLNTASQINAQLTHNISELIQSDLLLNINVNVKYDYLVQAFNNNSLLDWVPTVKLFMYHGDADTTVPYENSVQTYNRLIGNGASANIVTLTNLPGADHASGVVPYIEHFIEQLLLLK